MIIDYLQAVIEGATFIFGSLGVFSALVFLILTWSAVGEPRTHVARATARWALAVPAVIMSLPFTFPVLLVAGAVAAVVSVVVLALPDKAERKTRERRKRGARAHHVEEVKRLQAERDRLADQIKRLDALKRRQLDTDASELPRVQDVINRKSK